MEAMSTFVTWLSNNIYSFFESSSAWLVEQAVIVYYNSLVFMLDVTQLVADNLLSDISLNSEVQDAYNTMGSETMAILNTLNVPTAIANIIAALGVRFAFRLVI